MRSPRNNFEFAYPRAIRYLSIRPRSIHEIREYLKKKGVDADVVEEVINKLLSDKFLDDEEFAKWWTRGRQARGKAAFVIKRELSQKGVDKNIIETVALENAEDDLSVAREVVDKYHSRYAKYSGREYFQKMGAFLARRGFSWDVIKKAINS